MPIGAYNRAYNLEEFVRILDSWGLTDVLLPFLLYFVLIYAILQKSKILGEDKKRFNTVIALVISLLVVVPHVLRVYPPYADVVAITNQALPQVSLIVVAILMLMILIGLLGAEATWMGSSLSGWIAIVAFIVIIAIFGGAAGWWQNWYWFDRFFGSDTIAIVVMLLVFAVIIWFVTRGEGKGEKSESAWNKIGGGVRDLFGKK